MDPSSAQHHHQQEMSSQTLESMLVCTKSDQEKKPRPAEQQPQKCPRCDSANTKFCYYNNYSLSQPRYFCKSCRRYWTKGGTLKNVPVGGGCRKKQKSSSKRSSQDNSPNNPIMSPLTIPISSYDSSTDLSLAFARLQKQANGHLGIDREHDHHHHNNNMSMMYNPTAPSSFFDALRGGSFLESTPNAFQHNMYYGNTGQVENGGIVEMGMKYDQEMNFTTTTASATTTTVKQEMCSMARDEGENNSRILWGFPWQINGDVNMNMGDFESSNRQSWTEFGEYSFYGLPNSSIIV